MELKVSCRFIDNFQPTNSNDKLLQCYGIFSISLDLACAKVKNTPQPCDNPAHQRLFQQTILTPSARWGRDPCTTYPYAKTEDCSIFSTPTELKYYSLFGKNRITQEPVHRFASQINLLVRTWHKSPSEVIRQHTLVWK